MREESTTPGFEYRLAPVRLPDGEPTERVAVDTEIEKARAGAERPAEERG
jgi:hypothetical protein